MKRALILSIALGSTILFSAVAHADQLSLNTFGRETGLQISTQETQSIWSQLTALGTNQFLGGTIGSFKLDESSMIAGAKAIGTVEFDNFLRTGKLNSSNPDLANILSEVMSKGAGFDFSSMINSYTPNGGALSNQASANITGGGSASSADGMCSPDVAQSLVDQGNQHVNERVEIASSEEFGFSDLKQATGGTTGFAGMSCMDKLFQNAGSDILFKPPSLGSLTSQINSWSCDRAVGVAEQIAGAFGADGFQTAAHGGFQADFTMGEAQEMNPLNNFRLSSSDIFGNSFAQFDSLKDNDIKERTNIGRLFR